jgi:hypothetical protein
MPMGQGCAWMAMGLCGSMLLAITSCGVVADSGGEDATGDDPQDTHAFEPTPARGISILEIEINQGTRVAIGVGGDWIAESQRSGHLIGSRDSLMRIHYAVEPGWVPREIEARLTLELPDGSSKSFSDLRLIEGDSARENFYGPFYFGLVAELGETLAQTRYVVELWETEPGGEALSEREWANPAAGSQPIGFESAPMQIKMVLVPIVYQDTPANLDDATTQILIESLYEQNPVAEILYDVHDPVVYEGQLIDLVNLLPIMAELRSSENADANAYYHAFVEVGSSSLAGLYGISSIANDSEGDANSRVSATVLWSPNPSFAADTYTHETGHAQGMSHVECPNENAGAPDPAYPYADGRIGNWGFGIRQLVIYDPDNVYDYMSYCGPSWVSDWTWNKAFDRIRTLTAWDFSGAAPSDARSGARSSLATRDELLVVAVSADGSRTWWTMPGTIDPNRVDGRDRIEFELRSGEVIEALADVSTLSDGRTRWIKARLPSRAEASRTGPSRTGPSHASTPDMSEIAEIRHVRAAEVARINPAAIGLDLHDGCVTPGCNQTAVWQPAWKTYKPSSSVSVRHR